ncbi:MAG: SURF1 family protein [Pseudomonadota bacterium]
MTQARPFIRLRIGHLQLRAGLWPTLATLALLPLMIALGMWQLDRAGQKLRLQADYDRRQQEPAVRLLSVLENPEVLRFRRMVARGHYEPEHQILIDNRVHQGQAGYHVLTPLRLEDGAVRVLVNRGWVPLGQDRAVLPRIETPRGAVEVTGLAAVPQTKGFHLGGAKPPGEGWQPVWQYLDLDVFRGNVAFPVQPIVILLDPNSANGGFVRQWARLDAGIATHQGYAFQWFSLAAALAAIYILLNTRKTDHADNQPEKD